MSQISNEEINELLRQYLRLQEILTPEDNEPNICEAHKPKSEGGIYGWICPKCGAVMSPYQEFCVKCSGSFDFTWTANTNTTGTNYTIPSSSECSVNADKSRCHKCKFERDCEKTMDKEGKCRIYKRDPPDGGYYG